MLQSAMRLSWGARRHVAQHTVGACAFAASTRMIGSTIDTSDSRTPLEAFFAFGEDDVRPAPHALPSQQVVDSSPSIAHRAFDAFPDLVQGAHPGGMPSSDAVSDYVAPRVSDPQDRFHVSHPAAEGMMLDLLDTDTPVAECGASSSPQTLQAAYATCGPSAIWRAMRGRNCTDAASSTVANETPPEWFSDLCRDLYFRTTEGARLTTEKERAEASPDGGAGPAPVADGDGVDPFGWIDFNLFSEVDGYGVGPYTFPRAMCEWYSEEDRSLLCLGCTEREYVCFGEGYSFPSRSQLPTSLGSVPLRLLIDPTKAEPTVFIQLSPDMPPCLWLAVKPTAAAVRRVVSEFAAAAVAHRDAHHGVFSQRWNQALRTLKNQRMKSDDGDVLRMIAYQARDVTFAEAPIKEFPNRQEFFLGEYDEPERLMEFFDLCPFLFSVPLLRTVVDVHDAQFVPRIDGPGIATSLYRTIFSKSLLFVQVHLSAEVKLPPQDPDSFVFLWKDSESLPKSKIPIFVRAVWPTNQRMCGGGRLIRRFNETFKTEFSEDTPVDVCAAIWSLMSWAKQRGELMGVLGMRERLAGLENAAQNGSQQALLYPGTREIPNPEYTLDERVGMHIQYLAHLGDPEVGERIVALWQTGSPVVRMGCAKAALTIGDRALFRHIVSCEPEGRMQTYMTKLVRKRKSRDVVDAVPRLLDEQYEYAAPLWTKRTGGSRIVPGELGTLPR